MLVGGGDDEPAPIVADQCVIDEYEGYAPATTCSPRSVTVGDLIEVDQGSGM